MQEAPTKGQVMDLNAISDEYNEYSARAKGFRGELQDIRQSQASLHDRAETLEVLIQALDSSMERLNQHMPDKAMQGASTRNVYDSPSASYDR
jgi:predicted  nucleic acid-binding Zn-ribbon protein